MSKHSAAQGLSLGPPGWPDESLPPQLRSTRLAASASASAAASKTNSVPMGHRPLPQLASTEAEKQKMMQEVYLGQPPGPYGGAFGGYPAAAGLPGPLGPSGPIGYGWGYNYEPPRGRGGGCFGRGVEWDEPDHGGYGYYTYRPKKTKYHSKPPRSVVQPSYGATIPQLPLPTLGSLPASAAIGSAAGIPNAPPPNLPTWKDRPLPNNWNELSQRQRKAILKEMKKERKSYERLREQQVKLWRMAEKERRREEKTLHKAQEKERKRIEKETLYNLKHPNPHGKPLPIPDPPAPALLDSANPAGAAPAPALALGAPPPAGGKAHDPMGFMLLPLQEDFGVRRPFNGSGAPPWLGAAGEGWPTISRTMNHAIWDMSREERVHAIQKGTLAGPNW